MPRRSSPSDPERLLIELRNLLDQFEAKLKNGADLRPKVKALVPTFHKLRDIGSSLLPVDSSDSARARILEYFRRYPRQIIHGDELMVIAGIGDWPRRVRELRNEFGWKIVSGTTIEQMIAEEEIDISSLELNGIALRPEDYMLISDFQDTEAAFRWNIANTIRRKDAGVREKLLEYLRTSVGKVVTGEELKYLARDRSEWPRRIRELRTEEGWPIFTKQTGRPDLNVGEYILAADRQTYTHDRKIPDDVRRAVLMRDNYSCTNCGWSQSEWNTADPRFLELHHMKEHVAGGSNSEDNLITLCNRCHDRAHKHSR